MAHLQYMLLPPPPPTWTPPQVKIRTLQNSEEKDSEVTTIYLCYNPYHYNSYEVTILLSLL